MWCLWLCNTYLSSHLGLELYMHSFLVHQWQRKRFSSQGSRLSYLPSNHPKMATTLLAVPWRWPNLCQHIESGRLMFPNKSIISDGLVLLYTLQWQRWFDHWSQRNHRLRSTGVVYNFLRHTADIFYLLAIASEHIEIFAGFSNVRCLWQVFSLAKFTPEAV